MKKTLVSIAIVGALGITSQSAQAALASDANLSIDAGSNFGMEVSPGFILPTAISGNNGINIGTIQNATGSHSGAPDGSESPDIDNPWTFFSNTGMHGSSSAINILSDDGAGNVTLDFSGWYVTWNAIPVIDMGSGGAAAMTCSGTCAAGDTYELTYAAVVPAGDPSSFGGVNYSLNLFGTVSDAAVIPVPAAVWLFGSGLLGLVGVARRKAKV
jgi:hypothetical protein